MATQVIYWEPAREDDLTRPDPARAYRGVLTTDHPASSHGVPVLVLDGSANAFGPCDVIRRGKASISAREVVRYSALSDRTHGTGSLADTFLGIADTQSAGDDGKSHVDRNDPATAARFAALGRDMRTATPEVAEAMADLFGPAWRDMIRPRLDPTPHPTRDEERVR